MRIWSAVSPLATIIVGLAPLVLARPPPTTGDEPPKWTPEVSPNYATLSSPLSGERFYQGKDLPIRFTDQSTSATEARFSISNYTGVYLIGKASLKNNGHISTKFKLPNWVADGTYDFVASENDGPFGSDDFNTDVVICTVFVGHPRPGQMEFAPFRNQAEQDLIDQSLHRLQKREPHPPKFVAPTTNQSVPQGSPIAIRFLDGQLDPNVTQARFVLRSRDQTAASEQELVLEGPDASEGGLYTFDGVLIQTNVTPPPEITPGTYSLVAEEVDPQDPREFQRAASIDIQIVPAAQNSTDEPQRQTLLGQESNEQDLLASHQASLKIRSPALEKRAGSPAFITPTKNQKITTGHHLNISFVNADRKTDRVRFILKPISAKTTQKQLVLFSRNALSEHLFLNETTCNARVFFPLGIAGGDYDLVAQEVYSEKNLKEVGWVRIKVVQPKKASALKSRDLPMSRFPSSGGLLDKPVGRRMQPLDSASEDLAHAQPTVLERRQSVKRRESATMLEPTPNQNVPSGSTFFCRIQDKHATSETAHFVLRSFGGYEQYLGAAKFVNGVATLKTTCPTDLRYDTYYIAALQNSIKRPQTFLDVISTAIIVSHARPTTQIPLGPREPFTSSAHLAKPVYDQSISGGKIFECRLLNGIHNERVKFMLRLGDGRSDLAVGNCEFKENGVAQTMCQIPSSITPGTYTFVAQKSSMSQPDSFQDVDQVIISLANPRGFGPDLEPHRHLPRRALASSHAAAPPSSVLLQPTRNQALPQGQGFTVKMAENNAPPSSLWRFLLKPATSSPTPEDEEHVLGTTSNPSSLEQTLKCPEDMAKGNYLFVVQNSDPNDPQTFFDAASAPVVVVDPTSRPAM